MIVNYRRKFYKLLLIAEYWRIFYEFLLITNVFFWIIVNYRRMFYESLFIIRVCVYKWLICILVWFINDWYVPAYDYECLIFTGVWLWMFDMHRRMIMNVWYVPAYDYEWFMCTDVWLWMIDMYRHIFIIDWYVPTYVLWIIVT